MIVYISGPMTGYVDFNRDAFFAAEAYLAAKGFHVVNPAALDAADPEEKTHAEYLRRDLAFLLDCDLIYMLPGWEHSKGASIENTVAKAVGILELHDPDVETWRTFEGEPEVEDHGDCDLVQGDGQGRAWCAHGEEFPDPPAGPLMEGVLHVEAGNLADFKAALAGLSPAGDEDLSAEPDVDGESHYLAGVERFQAGDEFPNVGYVRRMRALAEHPEPSPLAQHGGVVMHTTLPCQMRPVFVEHSDNEALIAAGAALRLLRGGRA